MLLLIEWHATAPPERAQFARDYHDRRVVEREHRIGTGR